MLLLGRGLQLLNLQKVKQKPNQKFSIYQLRFWLVQLVFLLLHLLLQILEAAQVQEHRFLETDVVRVQPILLVAEILQLVVGRRLKELVSQISQIVKTHTTIQLVHLQAHKNKVAQLV